MRKCSRDDIKNIVFDYNLPKKTLRLLNFTREKVACIQKYLINSIDHHFFFFQDRVVATNDTRRGYGLQ